MEVKCYLAKGPELNRTMMELLSLTRNEGHNSLGALYTDQAGISLDKERSALILVGGRDSIHKFLMYTGPFPHIIGTRPFLLSFARKHRVFGKNETCLKIVCGSGHHKPEDGSDYVALGLKGTSARLAVTPPELGHCLYFIYGWG